MIELRGADGASARTGEGTSVDSLIEQGYAALGRGEITTALGFLTQVLAREPDRVDLLNDCGGLNGLLGRQEEAVGYFQRALAAEPERADVLNNLGLALGMLGRHEEAIAYLAHALRLQPGYFDALCNLGYSLSRARRYVEALESLDRALAMNGAHVGALCNRGIVLAGLGRFPLALESFDRALALQPDDVSVLINRGAVLWSCKRDAEARACLERALILKPDNVDAVSNLGFVELGEGNLTRGFKLQEVRWQTEQLEGQAYTGAAPLWLGEQSLAGKTIFVHHEQGFGDTLQLVRYVPWLAQRGARVILRVQQPLKAILATFPGASAVISDGESVPAHDFHCPLMSLLLAFGTSMESIPGGVPYVQADPRRVEGWRQRLGPPSRPRIGLVWAGRQHPPINVARDMSLSRLIPLLELDADFISLQKEVPEADRPLLGSLPEIARRGETLEDFADTAALIATLDLVIAVDTAVVHLAGAMGKPVWIMNRYASCWRWLRDGRADSPWYPSVRLFRQPSLEDWASVVRDVKEAAEVFVKRWSASAVASLPPERLTSATLMRRGAILMAQGDLTAAISCYTEILAVEPDHVAALSALGRTLGQSGYHAQALVCFEKGLTIAADDPDLVLNRGIAVLALGREEEALLCFEGVLGLDSSSIPARLNRGLALIRLGRSRQALVNLDELLSMDPLHVEARCHRSTIYLRLGNLRDGFREFESRWQTAALSGAALRTSAPLWLGETPVQGGTLLLHHEQGFGDDIQFARYIPQVARLWDRVLLGLPRDLHRLARLSFAAASNVEVLPPSTELPAHDRHCPMMSLPLAFGTTLESIPGGVPYVHADPGQVEAWRQRLTPSGRPRIGLLWAGRQYPPINILRDMSLRLLLPLLELDAEFISLQKEVPAADLPLLGSLPRIARLGETLEDFADTAALIQTLDLVISVDTAVVHVAGAMGKPTWVLLPRGSCWRWLTDRSDSPWYPTLRLFRQSPQGGWEPVVAQVKAALTALLAGAVAA
jgi:tetratricopeptide (TPR) repeat protein